MLKARTVFVLGAGASQPYGFQTGATLVRDILLTLKPATHGPLAHPMLPAPPPGPYEWLVELGFTGGEIATFLSTLGDSGQMSVDAFLEHRTEFQAVGKAAIAAQLMPLEKHEALFAVDAAAGEHWYRYLFGKLNTKFEDLDRNDVAFITFNYDRSWEYFLLTAIQNAYGKTFVEAADKIKKFRALHMHGDLGELTEEDAARWRGSAVTADRIASAAARIKIVHDEQAEEQFLRARQLLHSAEIVCFLGFGFHPTNMARLFEGFSMQPNCRAIGSGFGLRHAERGSVRDMIRKHVHIDDLGDQTHKVLEFLRQNFLWW